jgi:hypothetical protein
LKVKTLPTPLYRFFELQKSIKERMHQEQIDEANKEKDKEKAKMKKSLREKTRLKTSYNSEKSLPNNDDGKNSQIDLKLIEEFGNHCAADEGEGESSGRSGVHEDSNEVHMTEETPIYDLSNNRIEEPTITIRKESTFDTIEGSATVKIAEDTAKVADDADVPAGPKSSSPSFLSDPAYALIGRDFGVCIVLCIIALHCIIVFYLISSQKSCIFTNSHTHTCTHTTGIAHNISREKDEDIPSTV